MKLNKFERFIQIVRALYRMAFEKEPKSGTERIPIIKGHIAKARLANTRLGLVNHATSAYGMTVAGGEGAEHIESCRSQEAFDNYLVVLREIATDDKISRGLSCTYGEDAAIRSFNEKFGMYLNKEKNIESGILNETVGMWNDAIIPSESVLLSLINATPDQAITILKTFR